MRNFLTGILLIFSTVVIAQQDFNFTQFNYNKQSFNPGFVADENLFQTFVIVRDQWVAFEGSPTTQMIGVEFPIAKYKIGLGVNVSTEQIGIQKRTNIQTNYRYRLKMNKSILQFGIGMSFRNYVNDFTDERINAIDGFIIDPNITQERLSSSFFNVGVGMQYKTKGYYFGLSVPRIIRNRITPIEVSNSREVRHAYLVLGKNYELTEYWTINPEALIKYTNTAPAEFDLHLEAMYDDQFLLGFNYRAGGGSIGESFSLIAGVQVLQSSLIGLAYDIGASNFRTAHNGSFELFFRYRNTGRKSVFEEIINPRYY